MEGQHQSPLELVTSNLRAVLNDVINKLESRYYSSNIDYVRYKIDWICTLLVRLGGTLEESVLPYLQEAAWMLAVIDQENDESSIFSPTEVKSGFRGRPKFDISGEQLEYFLDNGFKATDIAKMLCVSVKTVYRRLAENGLSICDTCAVLTEQELDEIIKNVLMEFPNCGYKSMRGHFLSAGYKVQENRIQESMRRADPDGTVVRAIQIHVTHRRSYSVRSPLSLWHIDGNHKLIR